MFGNNPGQGPHAFVCKLLVKAALAIPLISFANEIGWTVGAGLVTSDVIELGNDAPFPTARFGDKEIMLLPNLRYQGENWSLGADGLGWKSRQESGLTRSLQLGYPASSVGLSGERGWLRYGLNTAVVADDGWLSRTTLIATPLTTSVSVGLGEREADRQQTLSFGVPLLLSEALGLTVIGRIFVEQENATFLAHDLGLRSIPETDDYLSRGLQVFSIWQATDRLTVLLRLNAEWNDDALLEQNEAIPAFQFNSFVLFSYHLGRLTFPTLS